MRQLALPLEAGGAGAQVWSPRDLAIAIESWSFTFGDWSSCWAKTWENHSREVSE